MPSSRAVLVLGMHRSGTSAIARGLAALGVYLGSDFLDAQPENPTGYWEDKGIVERDDRLLKTLGLQWDSIAPIERSAFRRWRAIMLEREAARYCRRCFTHAPLWGFKDPRAIRVLPFWEGVLRRCRAEGGYLVAIRHPRSIAASLFKRQAMPAEEANRLWLAHMVPFLGDVFDRPLVVVDYDLLMHDPRAQLARVAMALDIGADIASPRIDEFVAEFLDDRLRHTAFTLDDFADESEAARLTRQAFVLLYELAQDRQTIVGQSFRSAWRRIEIEFESLPPPSGNRPER